MKIIGILVLIAILFLAWFIFKPTKAPENVSVGNVSNSVGNSDGSDESNSNNSPESTEVAANPEIESKINSADVTITGYGPGKSHPGTFDEYTISELKVDSETGILSSGKVVIKSESRKFEKGNIIDKLNDHLCAEEFLNCAEYPDITVELTDVSMESAGEYRATGNLTFLGTTKSIDFPVTQADSNYTVDFRIDLTPFGLSNTFANSEVRIQATTQ
jgi:polyisoprenoid-binding protein YceI